MRDFFGKKLRLDDDIVCIHHCRDTNSALYGSCWLTKAVITTIDKDNGVLFIREEGKSTIMGADKKYCRKNFIRIKRKKG